MRMGYRRDLHSPRRGPGSTCPRDEQRETPLPKNISMRRYVG